jgi:RNA polymerase sigma-70 factor (ECF subfamily)
LAVDAEMVSRFFVRQRLRLAAYIWVIAHDEQIVEEVLQDICVLALRKLDAIRDGDHLGEWMYRAARLETLRHIRAKSKRHSTFNQTTLDLLDQDWRSGKHDCTGERISALKHCMSLLSSRARKLLSMRYVDNLKPAQIAQQIGNKTESVYASMSRIVSRLGDCVRSKLESELPADGDD